MATRTPRSSKDSIGIAKGYRSGLEEQVALQLAAAGVDAAYESRKIEYTKPEKKAKYTPDFVLPNGLIIETKGRFLLADRQKHVLLKEQHPELDIRFVFERSKTPINKGSPTTYATWCEKNGIRYADKFIPQSWMDEPEKVKSKT